MQLSPAPALPQNPAAATNPQQVQNSLQQVASQATAPISQQAITPTDKAKKTAPTRSKDSKDPKDPLDRRKEKKERGSSVNVSI